MGVCLPRFCDCSVLVVFSWDENIRGLGNTISLNQVLSYCLKESKGAKIRNRYNQVP